MHLALLSTSVAVTCAVAACADPRVRGGGRARVLGAALLAAAAPAGLGVGVLWLADPATLPDRSVLEALVVSAAVGAAVGLIWLGARAAWADRRHHSTKA